ncbi:MAG: hypothetical protein BYD32DRAFT_424188 [Podila humilis]|nr:MAG: hypothetical protein BYD32DRAFT_424188 [Podila humilis]
MSTSLFATPFSALLCVCVCNNKVTWCPKCNLSGSCIVSVACLKRTCLPSLPLHCE